MALMPRARTTGIVAAVTLAAFFLAYVTQHIGDVSVLAGFIPLRLEVLLTTGKDIPTALQWLPIWLTPLTATLVHSSWIHVGLNLMILIYCGRQIEHLLGTTRFMVLYVIGAYAAALAQWLSAPMSPNPMVGASGAISAVIGTYALIYSRREVAAIGPVSAQVVRILWLAAGWTVIQVMIGFSGLGFGGAGGSIAIWAHVGGFIAGLLLARPLLASRFKRQPRH
jgi:membrane associated rhomboid family serine protease